MDGKGTLVGKVNGWERQTDGKGRRMGRADGWGKETWERQTDRRMGKADKQRGEADGWGRQMGKKDRWTDGKEQMGGEEKGMENG